MFSFSAKQIRCTLTHSCVTTGKLILLFTIYNSAVQWFSIFFFLIAELRLINNKEIEIRNNHLVIEGILEKLHALVGRKIVVVANRKNMARDRREIKIMGDLEHLTIIS